MDFSKIQSQRRVGRRRQRVVRALWVILGLMLVAGAVPFIQREARKEQVKADATAFLELLKAEKYADAWSRHLKPSLKQKHAPEEFASTFSRVVHLKGELERWLLVGYSSRPGGKPYELLSYELQFTLGIAEMDIAMEAVGDSYSIRAYRFRALGL